MPERIWIETHFDDDGVKTGYDCWSDEFGILGWNKDLAEIQKILKGRDFPGPLHYLSPGEILR